MRPIRIALTKGRLEQKAISLFDKLGFNTENLVNKGRRLILPIYDKNGVEYETVLAKSSDVVTYVEHGATDLGIVGRDTIMEMGGTFYEMLDLKTGICRFCLANEEGKNFYSGHHTKKVATKYPNVTRRFFEEKGMDVDIIKIDGSVELAPLLSLSDGIVDLVETGSTLKANGLSIVEDVCKISARVIVNMASLKLQRESIMSLLDDISSVIEE